MKKEEEEEEEEKAGGEGSTYRQFRVTAGDCRDWQRYYYLGYDTLRGLNLVKHSEQYEWGK